MLLTQLLLYVYIMPDGMTLISKGQWLFLSTRRVAGLTCSNYRGVSLGSALAWFSMLG